MDAENTQQELPVQEEEENAQHFLEEKEASDDSRKRLVSEEGEPAPKRRKTAREASGDDTQPFEPGSETEPQDEALGAVADMQDASRRIASKMDGLSLADEAARLAVAAEFAAAVCTPSFLGAGAHTRNFELNVAFVASCIGKFDFLERCEIVDALEQLYPAGSELNDARLQWAESVWMPCVEPSGLPAGLLAAVRHHRDWTTLSDADAERRLARIGRQADRLELSGQQRCQLLTELGRHCTKMHILVEAIYALELSDMWVSAHGFEDSPLLTLAYAIACPGVPLAKDTTLLARIRDALRYMFDKKLHVQQPGFTQ